MEKEIQKFQTESILPKISEIKNETEIAVVIFQHVKKSDINLPQVTVDHATYPTINKLINTAGKASVKIFLVMMIEDCVKAISVNQPTKDQVMGMADEMIKDFQFLKPEDFQVFFTNYKKGIYGKDYNRFDMATIYQAMEIYLAERSDIHEQQVINQRSKQNSLVRTGETDIKHLYDKVLTEQEIENQKRETETRRKKAIAKWTYDYQMYFHGQVITPEMDAEYRIHTPLDEDYINNFKII